jgi:hypothetical protein
MNTNHTLQTPEERGTYPPVAIAHVVLEPYQRRRDFYDGSTARGSTTKLERKSLFRSISGDSSLLYPGYRPSPAVSTFTNNDHRHTKRPSSCNDRCIGVCCCRRSSEAIVTMFLVDWWYSALASLGAYRRAPQDGLDC